MKLVLVFAMLVGTEALTITTQSYRRTSCTHRKTYPHRECNKYYSCDRGQLVLETCEFFYVYSTSVKQCVPRYSRHDRCTKKATTTTESITTAKKRRQKIETTTIREKPSTSLSTFNIDWLFTSESVTTTENNQIEMQQSYITPDIFPDVTNEKIKTEIITKQRDKSTTKAASTTTTKEKIITKQSDKSTTKAASTTTTEAFGSREQNCTDRVVYSDPKDCRKYYYCNDGKLEPRKCFLGFFFSQKLQNCVPPSSQYADCKRRIRIRSLNAIDMMNRVV